MKTTVYLVTSLLIASSVCYAEKGDKRKRPERPERGAMVEKLFAKIDADSNGTISLEEFKAGPRAKKNPEKAEEYFKKLDKDSSGGITLEEMKSAGPAQRPKKAETE